MDRFTRGDVLWGTKRKFEEARHPIVYMGGPSEAPLAVILTSEDKIPCNMPLLNTYRGNKTSYFVGHLIEKMAEWGPYEKYATLKQEDLKLIERHIASQESMTWSEYLEYKRNGCSNHQNTDAVEGSK